MRSGRLLGVIVLLAAVLSAGCCCSDRCHVRRPFWRLRQCGSPCCSPCCPAPCCPTTCCASPHEVPIPIPPHEPPLAPHPPLAPDH